MYEPVMEFDELFSVDTFKLTAHFWQGWIHEKAKLIESTDELGNDLAGVMTLQRRLSTMERDLAAIQAKVTNIISPFITSFVYFWVCSLALDGW